MERTEVPFRRGREKYLGKEGGVLNDWGTCQIKTRKALVRRLCVEHEKVL